MIAEKSYQNLQKNNNNKKEKLQFNIDVNTLTSEIQEE